MTEKENEQVEKENGTAEENETELESSIIRQVEFYFGDANLPRDKFLREQIKLDDGWVPIEIMITFNRLAKLSKDVEVIAKALNKSTSGLLEVSEDEKKVRRSPEMPLPEMNEDRRKELLGRTIYAKGFPKDSVLDDLLQYFKGHGEVVNVIMRRYLDRQTKTRKFKGSVFVTFSTKEEAEKFVNNKDLKYKDTELLIRWQEEYLTLKHEEYVARKESKDKKSTQKPEEKEELKLPTGTVLHFSGGDDKMTRENVRDALTAVGGDVAYIDFKVGDKEGWARLTKEGSAKETIEKIPEGKLKIVETDVSFKVLEGDEETAFLQKTVEEMTKRRKNIKNNRHNRGGGKNFRGKQGGRKRKQGHHEDAPAPKSKVESS